MKKEKPYKRSEMLKLDSFYDIKNQERVIQNVPVEHIKATSREGFPDDSWFDLAKNASSIIYDGEDEIRSNIDTSRIRESLEYLLNAEHLSSYHQSLVDSIAPVQLNYYDQEDIYEVGSDGNHRTILAKLTNAPFIKARIIPLTFNQEKYDNYIQVVEQAIETFNAVIDQLGFTSDDEAIYYNESPVIVPMANGIFKYYFKLKMNKGTSLVSYSDESSYFINKLQEVTKVLYQIHETKKQYQRFYNRIKWLKAWSLNKVLLELILFIRCSWESFESDKYILAFSMMLDDNKMKSVFHRPSGVIAL